MSGIRKLIINSPFKKPSIHWHYNRETRQFEEKEGRRPAGYVVASSDSQKFDDPGIFVEIELVNRIRDRVDEWVDAGYPGITSTTKRLIQHWEYSDERGESNQFFFCQLEAIKTLIWCVEAPDTFKSDVNIQGDGGPYERLCSKMATGTGKTVVMAMIIAWNILNKAASPKDTRFSKNVFVVAPGLTVKNRLQVLDPNSKRNYYDEFDVVPASLMDKLRQGRVFIQNWHALSWDTQEKLEAKIAKKQIRSVDKRKRWEISGKAYVSEVLGVMKNARNILVINDEAHHAWRVNPDAIGKNRRVGSDKDSVEEATVWVGGLDKIHKQIGVLRCFDLSATPYTPSGKKIEEESLFNWIVSDFGLNDAIESGLVKTPRVVIRDNSRAKDDFKSSLYHIYNDDKVKADVNRSVDASVDLPELLENAYFLLGQDWKETKSEWLKHGHKVPPVMITVANRVETSARIYYALTHQRILNTNLFEKGAILQIDSKVLKKAESKIEGIEIDYGNSQNGSAKTVKLKNNQERDEYLRKCVDTVGKEGEPGEQIQCVISVGMLSEGWDAKTVTHIMGVRAFTSQLLCEQVIGRGLRRVSYEVDEYGLFEAEYVNIFGVPFTFLPHEGGDDIPPPPPVPKTRIEPVNEKLSHEISWPNVVRIDRVYKSKLILDWTKVNELELDPYAHITEIDLAAIIAGKPHSSVKDTLVKIALDEFAKETRVQTIVFNVTAEVFSEMKKSEWKGRKELYLIQIVRLVDEFIHSNKFRMKNESIKSGDDKWKLILILNMNKIIRHIWSAIQMQSAEVLTPIYDSEKPIKSTSDMRPWFTSKPCEAVEKSHINFCVYDSSWEATEATIMNKCNLVESFVKNDHLGFTVFYNYKGVTRKYYPDFIVKLSNDHHLVLEVKGLDSEQNKTKREYLNEWVEAVNSHKKFGRWHWAVSFDPSDVVSKIEECFDS